MRIIAVIDANVLWSAALRDILLRAASRGLYQPAWTDRIINEMAFSLKARRPDLDPARIDRTVSRILEGFPEALVEGYDDITTSMLNHEGDRHVLAAAVQAKANIIVTNNVNHFPAETC